MPEADAMPTDEALGAALTRAEAVLEIALQLDVEILTTEELHAWDTAKEQLQKVAPQALAGWVRVVKALVKVSSDGKCGYCNSPIETFASGDVYCACTPKRPCRHRYFSRPLDGHCVPCQALAPFVAAFPPK